MSWNVGQVVNLNVDADEDDTRPDRWLKRTFHGLTQGQTEKARRPGEIRLDGPPPQATPRPKARQTVRAPPPPPRRVFSPPPGAAPWPT